MICSMCGKENSIAVGRCVYCGVAVDNADQNLSFSRGSQHGHFSRNGQNGSRLFSGLSSAGSLAKVRKRQGGQELNVSIRHERSLFDHADRRYSRFSRRSSSGFRLMMGIVIFLVMAIGAAWGMIRLLDAQERGGIAADNHYMPDIENDVDENGEPIHTLIFYGDEGDIIYIRELRKNFTVATDNVRVSVPDSFFISENPDSESVEVTLHPVLYPLGKKAREMDPVTYSVNVPLSPLIVLQPQSDRAQAFTSIYLIQVEVLPGSKVWIDDTEVTDLIDAGNIIAHNVEIAPIGDNVIDVAVSSPGHRTSMRQVVISRPYMDIPLEVDITAPAASTSSLVTITGKTSSGAQLSVEPDAQSIMVKEDGAFVIEFRMKKYGENNYKITASLSGKQDSSINHTIVYSPNLDEYSRSAWKMEYDHLVKNQASFQGRIYKCTGVLKQELSDNPYVFTFNVGGADAEQLIVIQMIKDKPIKLEAGKKYDIYADLEGTQDGYPRFNGRFCLEAPTK